MNLSITARVVSVIEGPFIALGIDGNDEDLVIDIRDDEVLEWAKLLGQDVELAVVAPAVAKVPELKVAELIVDPRLAKQMKGLGPAETSQLQAGAATLCSCFEPYCDPASCPAHVGGKVSPDFDGIPKWPERSSAAETPEPAAETSPSSEGRKPEGGHWRDQLPPKSEWMTVAEWAAHVGVSATYAYNLSKRDRLPVKAFPSPTGHRGRATILMVPAGTTWPPRATSDPDDLAGWRFDAHSAEGAIKAAGLTRREQLTAMTKTELLALPGLGPKTVEAIESELLRRGFQLAKEPPPPPKAERLLEEAQPGDEQGRDAWCAALRDALKRIASGTSKKHMSARRCLLRSIDDCMRPHDAAAALEVSLSEWVGARGTKAIGPFFEAHEKELVKLGRQLLKQRGIPQLETPPLEEFAEARP